METAQPNQTAASEEALAGIAFRRAGWALLVIDPATNLIVAANPAAAAMYDYPIHELVGLAIDALFAPESRVHLPEYRARVHSTGRAAYESVHLRRDGSPFATDVVVTADYDEQGAVRYRIVNVQSIA